MAKYCNKCDKKLTFDDSFVWEGRPICKSCLKEEETGQEIKEAEQLRGEPRKCAEASEALSYAIFSLFCLGFIFGPLAISKANKAERFIAEDPALQGEGKAKAGRIIGIISLILWSIALLSRLSQL